MSSIVTDYQMDPQVNAVLSHWNLPSDATARLINVSENHTYMVDCQTQRWVLRVHRDGNHSVQAIRSEIAWTEALQQDGALLTPRVIPGIDGHKVQKVWLDGIGSRFLVLFEFVPGSSPNETCDLTAPFEQLGGITARAHLHSIGWSRPGGFTRMSWNTETMFGRDGLWGDWRDAPNVTPDILGVLERVEERVKCGLTALGRGAEDYGLIHADMRLANLLTIGDTIQVIDFDDAGMGWFLYDFAAAVSFMEDDPRLPDWKEAWLRGYRTIRPLPDRAEQDIDTLIMLRRLALLAWIGSRIESPEPQALAPDFARVSAELGKNYLTSLD